MSPGHEGKLRKKCGHKMREVIEGGEVDGSDGRRNSDGGKGLH